MTETRDFLVEIGTEELPPKSMSTLIEAFRDAFSTNLRDHQLPCEGIEHYATPRRLALLAHGVPIGQPEQRLERKGPALAVAFDAAGNPTAAAEGFARSCGRKISELDTVENDKGAWLAHCAVKPGRPAADLLPELVQSALDKLPIRKRMRWGTRREQFVRPIHWVVALFGNQVLGEPIMGLRPSSETFGHRFHHPGPIPLSCPTDYARRLATKGYVVPEYERRKQIIRAQVEAAAEEIPAKAAIDETMLAEVAALVEWPVALLAHFDDVFLDLPKEVLVSTMQDHQRYFPVIDQAGDLLPSFVVISNIDSRDPNTVRKGNERVVRPRFADAKFFWDQDRKRSLASRIPELASIVYQRDLGSLAARVARLAELTIHLADKFQSDASLAKRAADLAKCDLITHMVTEFPELQGIMGGYYAQSDGEDAAVAKAVSEQYLPRFSGDSLPSTPLGQALAVAERLEGIVGIFSVGKHPTGARDPYGLRRSALGIIRIAIEHRLPIDLDTELTLTAATFPDPERVSTVVPVILEFFRDRLKSYCLERGYKSDEVEATSASGFESLVNFADRLAAVSSFRKLDAAASLEAANKRIRNILKKGAEMCPAQVDESLLREAEEVDLAQAVTDTRQRIEPLLLRGEYQQTLEILAELRGPVDLFFDKVLVMAEEPAVRSNRIALLRDLAALFSRIADFSRLQR